MNDAFEERIVQAARRTWDVIGGDCLVNEDGEMDESVILDRDTVCEVVADANHMHTNGGLSKEDMKRFYALSWKESKVIMRKAFTHNTYGW
jgi:hypothetical protein